LSGAAIAWWCIWRWTSSIRCGTCRGPDAAYACDRCSTPWDNVGVGAGRPTSLSNEMSSRDSDSDSFLRLLGGAMPTSIRRQPDAAYRMWCASYTACPGDVVWCLLLSSARTSYAAACAQSTLNPDMARGGCSWNESDVALVGVKRVANGRRP